MKSKPGPARAAGPGQGGPRFPAWLLALLLALATLVLYWPATRCDFINYDDPQYVTANPHVQNGLTWTGVKWAFESMDQGTQWAPLTWLTHELACQLFGLNPWGHHLLNVLLHAANTALVFLVFRRMTRATWRSLMLAALFGWHPLRVESVAWVAERKDVLGAFFWMLTLWAYAEYVAARQAGEAKAKAWYGAALAMFVSGLMSKAMVVTLPCVLLLLDYWPLGRFKLSRLWPLVREKIPFLVLTTAASGVTFIVQQRGGAVMPVEVLPVGARVGNALIAYCRYLGKTFWPADLAVFYPHPGYWPLAQVVLAGVLVCGISAVMFMARRGHPYLLTGWLWFVGTLVPVIGLVQVGGQSLADRYTYIPSLGVLILTIWGAEALVRGWRYHGVALAVAGSVALALCGALTREQLGYWRDSETLFRHALAVTKNNYVAHDNLGSALDKNGQTGEAIIQFQAAIRLNPGFADSHFNFGNALLRQGHTDEAINQYQAAIRLKPNEADAHNNLGIALFNQGHTDEAIRQFQAAIRLKPDDAGAYNNLGNAFFHKGQADEAIRQFQKAIRVEPDDSQSHFNLGVALNKNGQTGEAIRQYEEAIRVKPDNADAHFNLGNLLFKQGHTDEAISQYQEAVRFKPDDVDVRINLGAALFNQGRTDEAIRQFQAAIRLKPDDAAAQSDLANALELKRKSNERIYNSLGP